MARRSPTCPISAAADNGAQFHHEFSTESTEFILSVANHCANTLLPLLGYVDPGRLQKRSADGAQVPLSITPETGFGPMKNPAAARGIHDLPAAQKECFG
jgi:hypothetical protein